MITLTKYAASIFVSWSDMRIKSEEYKINQYNDFVGKNNELIIFSPVKYKKY